MNKLESTTAAEGVLSCSLRNCKETDIGTAVQSRGPLEANARRLGLDEVWQAVEARKYEILAVMGAGSYGVVVKAKSRITGKKVAIKHMEVCK